jgi:hypothetical protein
VASVQLVCSVCRDDEDGRRTGASGDETEEVSGRRVGPVEILDDEDRRRPSETFENAQEKLEHAPLAEGAAPLEVPDGTVASQFGKQTGELGAGRSENLVTIIGSQIPESLTKGLDDWGEGKVALTDLDTMTQVELGVSVVRSGRQLGHEPGLPHPCFAPNEYNVWPRLRRDASGAFGEPCDLVVSTNQAGTGDPGGHPQEHGIVGHHSEGARQLWPGGRRRAGQTSPSGDSSGPSCVSARCVLGTVRPLCACHRSAAGRSLHSSW